MGRAGELQPNCLFCRILRGEVEYFKVFEDKSTLVFLDHRPLFPGHCLLIPKAHFETLWDLPEGLVKPIFTAAQTISLAVTRGMDAQGAFVAANNRISQSVPHFHVHIVPRRKGDGLKGFFWPRRKYRDAAEIETTLAALQAALSHLGNQK